MRLRLVMLLALTFNALPLSAASPARRAATVVTHELRRYAHDLRTIVTAPARWSGADWRRNALALGAIGGTVLLDDEIRDLAQRNRNDTTQNIADAVTPFGGQRAQTISLLLVAAGVATHNVELRDTGRDALEASVLAGRVITPLLKTSIGRARPFAEEGSLHFEPFGGDHSFPSGHATNAFAVARAIARHSHGRVVPILVYSLATSVAVARVHDDVHWSSDVLAGGIIGAAVAKLVVQQNDASSHVIVTPLVGADAFGVSVHWSH